MKIYNGYFEVHQLSSSCGHPPTMSNFGFISFLCIVPYVLIYYLIIFHYRWNILDNMAIVLYSDSSSTTTITPHAPPRACWGCLFMCLVPWVYCFAFCYFPRRMLTLISFSRKTALGSHTVTLWILVFTMLPSNVPVSVNPLTCVDIISKFQFPLIDSWFLYWFFTFTSGIYCSVV